MDISHDREHTQGTEEEGEGVMADNGALIEAESEDPSVQGMRQLLELLASEPRVTATAIQTVGSKGHDGFALALVIGAAALTPPPIRSAAPDPSPA